MKCLNPLLSAAALFSAATVGTAFALLFGGCSGGIEGTSATGGDKPSNASVAEGTITGFGSIFVNGVEYTTSTAEIDINEQSAAELALKLGMLVRVEGVIDKDGDSGTALRVSYDQNLEGPVSAITLINNDQKQLTILGVNVEVNRSAVFDNISFDTLMTGQTIEVSGYRKSGGGILATRLEKIDTSGEYEVEATITALDTEDEEFSLGSLTVNYSLAEFEGVTSATLAVGQFLEVSGNFSGSPAQFYATHIELDDPDDDFSEGDEVHLEGIIDNFVNASSFTINGRHINAFSADYENGNSGDLANGVLVDVEGVFNASNILVADSVNFIPEPEGELIGRVQSVNLEQHQLTVMGETYSVAGFTYYKDDSEAELQYFDLSDLSVEQWVELQLKVVKEVRYVTFLKRINAEDRSRIEGRIDSMEGTRVSIFGVVVELENIDVSVRDTFSVGSFIEAEGVFVEGVLVAEGAELEL